MVTVLKELPVMYNPAARLLIARELCYSRENVNKADWASPM